MAFNPSSLGDAPMLRATSGSGVTAFGSAAISALGSPAGSPTIHREDGAHALEQEERLLESMADRPKRGKKEKKDSRSASKSKKEKKEKKKEKKEPKQKKPGREEGGGPTSSSSAPVQTSATSVTESASYSDGLGAAAQAQPADDYGDDFEDDEDDRIPTAEEMRQQEEHRRAQERQEQERAAQLELQRERERDRERREREEERNRRREEDEQRLLRLQRELQEREQREEERSMAAKAAAEAAAAAAAAAQSSGPESVRISESVIGASQAASHRYSAAASARYVDDRGARASDAGSPAVRQSSTAHSVRSGVDWQPQQERRDSLHGMRLEIPPPPAHWEPPPAQTQTPRGQSSGALTPRRGSKTVSPQPALAAASQAQLQAHAQHDMAVPLSDAASLQRHQQLLAGAAPAAPDPATMAMLQQLLLAQQQQQQQQQQQRGEDDRDSHGGRRDRGHRKERERRARRERHYSRQAYMAAEEDAAGALMKRLASDVKSIFQELNTSIVAAERQRHVNEERYRRDREARDRSWHDERQERDDKERRERELREERFWNQMEEREREAQERREARERQFREDLEQRYRDLEHERDSRSKQQRDNDLSIAELDKEARKREDELLRSREREAYRVQLAVLQEQHSKQLEELRNHMQELRRIEVENLERRQQESLKLQSEQHEVSLRTIEMHGTNARRLEELIGQVRDEIGAVGQIHDRVHLERQEMLREQEKTIADQIKAQQALQRVLEEQKESLGQERARLLTLHSKFEICIKTFSASHQEECERMEAARGQLQVLRNAVEQERKQMIAQVHEEQQQSLELRGRLDQERRDQERRAQEERLQIARERGDLLARKESQNDKESAALQALISREQLASDLSQRLETSLREHSEKVREAELLREKVAREHQELLREREAVEAEKQELHALAARVKADSEEARRLHAQAIADREWTANTKQRVSTMRQDLEENKEDVERRQRQLRALQTQVEEEKREATKLSSQRTLEMYGRGRGGSGAAAHVDPVARPRSPERAEGHGGALPPTRSAAERVAQEQRMFLDALHAGFDMSAYPTSLAPGRHAGGAPVG